MTSDPKTADDPTAGTGRGKSRRRKLPLATILKGLVPMMPDHGIIDTLRMRIWMRMATADFKNLSKLGFQPPTFFGGKPPKDAKYPPTYLHYRPADGVKIFTKGRCTTVEFSVPRLLRGDNAYVAEVAAWEVEALVRRMTAGLLPVTTAQGRLGAVGRWWGVQRLDLAVDFRGVVWPVLECYRVARTPRSRSPAAEVRYTPRGRLERAEGSARRPADALVLGNFKKWRGFLVVIYDKSAEVTARWRRIVARRRRSGMAGLRGGLPPIHEPTGRVEIRGRCPRSVGEIMGILEPCPAGEGLPFCRSPTSHPENYRLSHQRLHFFAYIEMLKLESGAPLPPRRRAHGRARDQKIERVSRYRGALRNVPPRQRALLQAQGMDRALRRLGTKLSSLCWPGLAAGGDEGRAQVASAVE